MTQKIKTITSSKNYFKLVKAVVTQAIHLISKDPSEELISDMKDIRDEMEYLDRNCEIIKK